MYPKEVQISLFTFDVVFLKNLTNLRRFPYRIRWSSQQYDLLAETLADLYDPT